MPSIYKIEVNLYPSNNISPDEHFFWVLQSNSTNKNSDWCVEQTGWGKTYEEAWKQTSNFYNKYKTQ